MTTAATASPVPPLPFVVASWLGYPLDRIVEGLTRGSIAPPTGAPPGWMPPGFEAVATAPGVPEAVVRSEGSDLFGTHDDGATPGSAAPPDVPASPAASGDVRSAWLGLVRSIDASLDDATFDALWQRSGDDDASRAARIGTLLWRTVAGDVPADDGVEALAAAIADRGTRGTLIALAEQGSADLAQRARSDRSVLAALAALEPFALAEVGDGAPQLFSRFDPDTGEANASDAWIDDRAKHLAWREALRGHPDADDDLADGWRFADRTLGDEATITVGDPSRVVGEVVFARDDGDAVTGSDAIDRVHGGRGDDSLDGGGGDDLVEGAGGRDGLAGGLGNDRVEGGGGDDTLDGGRGDDRLFGGTGYDTYAFASGDGDDLVVDTDGAGAIVVDGVTLTGGEREMAFETAPDDGGGTTLTVRMPAADGSAPDVIRVRDWHDGDLGIHLGGQGEVPLPDTTATPTCPCPSPDLEHPSVTKPLVTPGAEWMPGLGSDAVLREDGNESGMGMPHGFAAHPFAVPATGSSEAGDSAVDSGAWTLAFSGGPGAAALDGLAVPPALDPGAVTAADVAGAIAGVGGDHDDGDNAADAMRLSWWNAHDARPGGELPVAPPHHRG